MFQELHIQNSFLSPEEFHCLEKKRQQWNQIYIFIGNKRLEALEKYELMVKKKERGRFFSNITRIDFSLLPPAA